MDKKINSVAFDQNQTAVIEEVVSSPSFQHTDWNKVELSSELQRLRSHIRSHYRKEQKARCAYCGKDLSVQSAANCHVEHIAPKSLYKEYMFLPQNLCLACADCNEIKGDIDTIKPLPKGKKRKRYPRASSQFKIIHPHFDNYDDHINVFLGNYYIDNTEKGHFTIGICKLNQRLQAYGVYEPDEMMLLAAELSRAKQEHNTVLVKFLRKKMIELCTEE
ncbi:HNH endonuclease [Vibrio fluvialis]